jgi:ABC-type uncharacterized transport system YnjBCD substrate-binding protein
MKPCGFGLILLVFALAEALPGQNYVNSQLPWHDAALDAHGKLLAWYHAERNQGYD